MGVRQVKGGEPPHEEVEARPAPELSRGRKPYQKPAFRFERVFETMALSCGKLNPTQLICRANRKNS
jgi:hypothetical protein